MNNKTIYKYFDKVFDYPEILSNEILPFGVLWEYVSSSFLNGLVNYANPVACYVLERYTHRSEDLRMFNYSLKGDPSRCFNFFGSKSELIFRINNNEIEFSNTNLRMFEDDVILISRLNCSKNSYVFFWFDMDVSDCKIGRFITEDGVDEVIKSIENFLNKKIENNGDHKFEDGCDNGICDYHKLDISFIRGWIKF